MIASDALNEPQEEEIPKGDDVDKELKAAQDAAKAAGDVAKNVFGSSSQIEIPRRFFKSKTQYFLKGPVTTEVVSLLIIAS